ncbi:hypothetical protein K7H20_23965 [Salipiger manganoxidans]|uniref:hypothetical protein n=1 Tax=Salipiger marinus TaxID=555512 RepID=UPI001E579973|nr:hypothetical protein [Salipiger manganoxidans]MCD1621097.1 hypothetical protein [Salipiger manganoxidans]
MPEHVESVKRIAAFFHDQVKIAQPQWKGKFEQYAAQLEAASDELVKLYGLTSALPPDLGNIHDLPTELLDELSVAKTDELEDQLVTVINSYGGEASLDQILVGLYRKFKVTQKRRFLQNKLYRMAMVWSVDGRKGYYTTTEPDDPSVKGVDETGRSHSVTALPASVGGFDELLRDVKAVDIDDEIPF